MHLRGFVHVNVNCSDFERSRVFYERLGFRVVAEVPEEGAPEVARAVGVPAYRLRGALMALEGVPGAPLIDLLEWREPRDPAPPYPHLYHLGIARIALRTRDLDADLAELRAAGVELLSEPARVAAQGAMRGSRFVCFRDPDGTVLELVEIA
jgi:catechol 2,3-dioxygenase-like lactoylglutathione lyase family enzyme